MQEKKEIGRSEEGERGCDGRNEHGRDVRGYRTAEGDTGVNEGLWEKEVAKCIRNLHFSLIDRYQKGVVIDKNIPFYYRARI